VSNLGTRLRIGEKIGLGFGLVGLIFLGVIWFYDINLRGVVSDLRELNAVYGARQSHAFEIESRLAAMHGAQERFLLTRDLSYAEETRRQAERLLAKAAALAEIDEDSRVTAAEIKARTHEFIARFDAIVAAWEVKGLDEASGLQGAFRVAAHELQERSRDYHVDRPYLLLLQIRRSEKDLALRGDPQYQLRVQGLLDEMTATIAGSDLPEQVQRALADEIATYRVEFDAYAAGVLAGEDFRGGKGAFRDAAHRIEAILLAHYVPFMETRILEMRRREKDYLLRGDEDGYVAMVNELAAEIRGMIDTSSIAVDEKVALDALLAAYERDFLALVDQDRIIAGLTAEMDNARALITPLVEANLAQANRLMDEMSTGIVSASADRARLGLLIAFGAFVLGALFSVLIVARIVRPVREMVGLLDRLTHENPTERITVDPEGRDEINAMAISLNTMADHQATYLHWWRSSMQEAIAMRDLHEGATDEDRFEAAEELRKAALSKLQQLNAIKSRLLHQAESVLAVAERIDQDHGRAPREDGELLRSAASEITTLVRVIDEH
jgi:methyl-accepting chemotaxis protein